MRLKPIAKKIISFAILFCCAGAFAEEVTRILATVNGDIVTSKDLEDYCTMVLYQMPQERRTMSEDPQKFGKQSLDRLIDDKLILDFAKKEKETQIKNEKDEEKKKKLEVPQEWIEERINSIIASFPSRLDFEKSLIEKGISMAVLRERMKEQYMVQESIARHVRHYVDITPNDILEYYNSHQDEFYKPKRYVFVVAKSGDRNELYRIEDYINKNSVDKALEQYSGKLLKLESTEAQLREEIASVLKEVKPGEARIRKIDDLFNLIYLTEIIEPRLSSFEDEREAIFDFLWNRKYRLRFEEWLRELRDNAVIKILDPAYQ